MNIFAFILTRYWNKTQSSLLLAIARQTEEAVEGNVEE